MGKFFKNPNEARQMKTEFELDKLYLLTRIYQPQNENGETQNIASIYLEPVFTDYSIASFNAKKSKIINIKDNSILKTLNEDFYDGCFVKISKDGDELKFINANDDEIAKKVSDDFEKITSRIRYTEALPWL